MNHGNKVEITTRSGVKKIYRNVTEIHWNFKPNSSFMPRVAFESDIHSTGMTIPCEQIEEMETTLETEKAPAFDQV